jgi:hypothetical protein
VIGSQLTEFGSLESQIRKTASLILYLEIEITSIAENGCVKPGLPQCTRTSGTTYDAILRQMLKK